jgi:hypothetical protein
VIAKGGFSNSSPLLHSQDVLYFSIACVTGDRAAILLQLAAQYKKLYLQMYMMSTLLCDVFLN